MRCSSLLLLVLPILLTPTLLVAAADRPAKEIRVVRLEVTPRLPDDLGPRLVPRPVEQVPGDAATLWLIAANDAAAKAEATKALDLEELPADAQQLRTLGGGVNPAYVQFARAASRRTRCTWNLPFREEGYAVLLPHLNGLRTLTNMLSVQSQAALAEGRPAEAIELAGYGYAMVRHLDGDEPFLVQSLVAAGICAKVSGDLEAVVAHRDAPNLYWALADLPRPIVDVRRSFEMEVDAFLFTFPALRDVRQRAPSEEEFRATLEKLKEWTGRGHEGGWESVVSYVSVLGSHARAREYLAAHGRSAAELDAMPPQQVISLYWVDDFERRMRAMTKWAALPYWQARPGLAAAAASFQRDGRGSNPLMHFVPALETAMHHVNLADRQVAALRCVEAVRAYAAEHGGRLPPDLDAIRSTPPPHDPFTGKPFVHRLAGDAFIVEAPAPEGMDARRGWRYEITLRK